LGNGTSARRPKKTGIIAQILLQLKI
jgi:hypothetical protein